MTELAIRDETGTELATVGGESVNRLAVWADSARAAFQVAKTLVETSFVPEAFRGKPMEATAAILAGDEVGLSPMASLRSFDIIQGTAAPRAATLRAVVQSRGHKVWLHEATDTRAIVRGQRAGEERVQESVWTIDRAKKLSLTGKKNWQAQPQAMLVARATAECCRLIASDAILGIPYASEELADADGDGYRYDSVGEMAEQVAKPATRKRQRAPLPPAEEPALDEPAPDMITKEQQSMMFGQFTKAGITEKDRMLDFIEQQIGRRIESRTDLTKAEATKVIDELLNLNVEEPDEPEIDDMAGE